MSIPSKPLAIIIWITRGLLAVAFSTAGLAKVAMPHTALLAALLLSVTIGGVILTHICITGGSLAPAVLLGLLGTFVAYRLRATTRIVSVFVPAPV